jgi:hypothetical protein
VRRKHTVEPFEKEVCDALGALIADQDELAVAELAGNPRKDGAVFAAVTRSVNDAGVRSS